MTTIVDIPLAYAYISFCMGALASETGWENTTYVFLAQDAWRALEITDEPAESDTESILKYYAVLKFKALDHFKRELSTSFDFSANGASDHRSQMFKQVSEMVAEAKMEAITYLPQGKIETGRFTFVDDPYSIQGQIERIE